MKTTFGILFLLLNSIASLGQKSQSPARVLSKPIISDSLTTLMIPTRYNKELLSNNKIALWNDFYANIIFYNFKTDSVKYLFKKDTFIKGFSVNDEFSYSNIYQTTKKNYTSEWFFYFVITEDYNKSGRIDTSDPAILYASDKEGNRLKAITSPNENAVSIEIYEPQGFALIKMQRDVDNDRDFEHNDEDYYYVRLNLKTLELGTRIELK